ncbi:MAG TPA: transcriptional regulator, partial [Rhodospirillaceae bacterium]|nr:transcriptional regulator [Rhodospirillaceae bacterium]
MSKSGRLFEIIQILRTADRPVTAQTIADGLE